MVGDLGTVRFGNKSVDDSDKWESWRHVTPSGGRPNPGQGGCEFLYPCLVVYAKHPTHKQLYVLHTGHK